MVVRDLMSFPAVTCGPSTLVAEAARLMSRHNCGCLLVTGDRGQLLGLITDRDIALALAIRPNTWGLAVRDAMTRDVESCDPEAPVAGILKQFTALGVRRLPVVNAEGHAEGLLSVDDVVLHAGEPGLPLPAVLDVLRAIAAAETGRVIVQ